MPLIEIVQLRRNEFRIGEMVCLDINSGSSNSGFFLKKKNSLCEIFK